MLSARQLWNIGCVLGASGVGLGAFGAHGLRSRVNNEQQLKNWETAAHYQMIHSLAILFASTRGHTTAGTVIAVGTVLFSGSIYALVLNRERFRSLGPVTPLGGAAMIAGWLAMIVP
ncbi:hypothetical protein BDF22DRAFT_739793 [Syncephalis plumigaleata]|nr:hypothetical protein BDF22DRAFT_739793 [Syncephalis plumigaleata]